MYKFKICTLVKIKKSLYHNNVIASSFFEREERNMQEQNAKKVYDVCDIQNILGLGRTNTYKFLEETYHKQNPFIVLKIGKLYKVPKESFDLWLNGQNIGKCQIEMI